MNVKRTNFDGALLLELGAFSDERGAFFESWNVARYRESGIDLRFTQSNFSFSRKNVLRGLHAQYLKPQGKLVTVVQGRIWDVIVDVRRGSPTFGKWQGFELSSENHHQLWVPTGFLHGFLSLEDGTVVNYLVTAPYHPAGDFSVAWNDPDIGIEWPLDESELPILSKKDEGAPKLSGIPRKRFIHYSTAL